MKVTPMFTDEEGVALALADRPTRRAMLDAAILRGGAPSVRPPRKALKTPQKAAKPRAKAAKKVSLPVKETAVVRQILEAIQLLYPTRIWAWRNNSGALATAAGSFVKFGATGSADILGVIRPSGRLLALEVKVGRGRVSEAQDRWLKEAMSFGALACVVWSLDEALNFLGLAMKEA